MLVQKFKAICDHDGCNESTKAIIKIEMKSLNSNFENKISFIPIDIQFDNQDWTWTWHKSATRTFCKKHVPKK